MMWKCVSDVLLVAVHMWIKALQAAKIPKWLLQTKKTQNTPIAKRTPYDAVNETQHLYCHQILVYPSINIVTRPIFHARSIALGGG